MDQPIILDKVLIVDDSPTFLVSPDSVAGNGVNDVFKPPVSEDFERQEQWINAIAHCPFLMPEHIWTVGNQQICIDFIPAEPYIADDEVLEVI